MDETYTAEQLREWAANSEASIRALGLKETDFKIANYLADVLRAHADALEENARLRERVALDDAEREYRRQSLANEIRETLKVRGHFAAERPSDLIGCVARAIESERDRANLAEAELAAERERADRNQEDAERYRWLQSEAKQVYMHPNAEIDNRMRWEFPVLIALTCINSEVSLNAAIDAARRK